MILSRFFITASFLAIGLSCMTLGTCSGPAPTAKAKMEEETLLAELPR